MSMMVHTNQALILVFLSCLCGVAWTQTLGFGKCPNPPVKKDFNVTKYLGDWYEIQRSRFVVYELFQKCIKANYQLNKSGKINVTNTGFNRFTKKPATAVGEAYAPDAKVPAKLIVKFGESPGGNYWVLDTDYTSYSIVYSCTSLGRFFYADTVWILGRERSMSAAKIKSYRKFIRKQKIRTSVVGYTDQKNCDQKEKKN